VLVRPPCSICGDPAEWNALTTWDCWADLCGPHKEAFALDAGPIWVAPEMAPLIGPDQARAYLAAQTWVFARTMPKWPHEYVLLTRSTDPWAHLLTVALIRQVGVKRRFAGRLHSYWQDGGHEYWTMRPTDTILNRKELTE
jgi:hypothetical protein